MGRTCRDNDELQEEEEEVQDVVFTHLGQKVNLKMLRGGSLLGRPPGALTPVDDAVLCENLVGGQTTPGSNNTAVRQTGATANVALGLQDVAVAYLEALAD